MTAKIFIVSLQGKIDQHSIKKLDNTLESLSGKTTNIILDISKVTFINSSGVGILVKYSSVFSIFVLVGISPVIKSILNILGATFHVFENQEQAKFFIQKQEQVQLQDTKLELYMSIPLCIAINKELVVNALCGICEKELNQVDVGPVVCRMDDYSIVCLPCSKQSPQLKNILDQGLKGKPVFDISTKSNHLLRKIVNKLSEHKQNSKKIKQFV